MNFVTIAGRLGKDPETRFTANNQKVTTFSLATNLRRGGNEETIWWRVTVWGERFDKMMPYLKKGSAAIVVGEISKAPEIYNDQSGQPRISSLEITAESIKFSPFGRDGDQQQGAGQGAAQGAQQVAGQQSYGAPAAQPVAQPAAPAPQAAPQSHGFAQPAAPAPQAAPQPGYGAPAANEPTKDDLPF